MLTNYFNSKIGQSLYRTVTSGDRSSYKTYARVYQAEVLIVIQAFNVTVTVNVQSHDLCSSGSRQGGTDDYLGDYTILLADVENSLEEFWSLLLRRCDPVHSVYFFKGIPK